MLLQLRLQTSFDRWASQFANTVNFRSILFLAFDSCLFLLLSRINFFQSIDATFQDQVSQLHVVETILQRLE